MPLRMVTWYEYHTTCTTLCKGFFFFTMRTYSKGSGQDTAAVTRHGIVVAISACAVQGVHHCTKEQILLRASRCQERSNTSKLPVLPVVAVVEDQDCWCLELRVRGQAGYIHYTCLLCRRPVQVDVSMQHEARPNLRCGGHALIAGMTMVKLQLECPGINSSKYFEQSQ